MPKLFVSLVVSLVLTTQSSWAGAPPYMPTILIDTDPASVVLESGRSIDSSYGLITTTIYGDGRVRLSNEAKRQPQYFEMRIGTDEVESLLQELGSLGFFEISTRELEQLVVRARGPDSLSALGEANHLGGLLFSVRLNWFQKPGEEGQSAFEHALVINGPGYYAQKYPQVPALQALKKGAEVLKRLEEDPRFRKSMHRARRCKATTKRAT